MLFRLMISDIGTDESSSLSRTYAACEVFDQLHALPSANAKANALTTRAGMTSKLL